MAEFWGEVTLFFQQNTFLSLGLLLISGYFIGKLCELIRIPAITGYIVAGLVLSPSVTGIFGEPMGPSLRGITEMALGLIAFTIGGEFNLAKLKRTGVSILVLTVFEALFAFLCVTAALTLFGLDRRIVFLMGAISAATAPAATTLIVRELRAKGEFIDYLYGVVALDDAVCIILFSIVFAVTAPLLTGVSGEGGLWTGLGRGLLEVVSSLALGLLGGLFIHLLSFRQRAQKETLLITLAILFLVSSLSSALGLSLLLANMAMGVAVINLSLRNRKIFVALEPLSPPVFALFFLIAGTELDIKTFASVSAVVTGLIYLSSRFIGKLVGLQLGGLIMKTPKRIRNFLGFCLFPQAGVAIGMALFIKATMGEAMPEVRNLISLVVNVVLFSVFINELIGPLISKFGIKRGCQLEES